MKRDGIIGYLGALDVAEEARIKEAIIYLEYGLDPNEALPLDAGIEAARQIYSIRLQGVCRQIGVAAFRLSGAEAIHKNLVRL